MDKKAKNILFNTYWSSEGWKKERTTNTDDFLYAKEKGLMFDPLTISHDDCVKKITECLNAITKEQAAKAFLSSLSTRRLDWRSGIGSYCIAELIKPHKYTPAESGYSYEDGKIVCVSHKCKVCRDLECGVTGEQHYENTDLNVLNFERIKWGGVRHGQLIYTLFDLEQLQKEQVPEPTGIDIEIFKGILNAADACKPNDYPSVLRDKLKDIPNLKSNESERSVILEILACIRVLKPLSYDRPTTGRHDWDFIEFWRGGDGCSKDAVEKYFGRFLKANL